MAPSLHDRQKVARDTIARSASITAETAGASLESIFISEQLPSLHDLACPSITNTELKIVNLDSFSAARNILETDDDAEAKVAVLNLASDEERAGGWIYSLATTQVRAGHIPIMNYEADSDPYIQRKNPCAPPRPCTKPSSYPTIPGQT